MKFLNNLLKKLYPPVQPLNPGIFSYRPQDENAAFPYPMHLRIEPDENGLLVLNGSTILHLNQTAAELVFLFIQGMDHEQISRRMQKRYQIPRETVRQDAQDLFERLAILMDTPDLDPVSFLDFERQAPYSGKILAPYRLDIALTYRFADEGDADEALRKRESKELSREEWLRILDRSWEIGIPHLVFTGGEPTICEYLPELVERAGQHGQVVGLLSNGYRLAESSYRSTLLAKGLDHLVLILEPDDERCWQAIEAMVPENLHLTAHLTITQEDVSLYMPVLERLRALGVKSLSLSANQRALHETLTEINEHAVYMGFHIEHEIPAPYSHLNPVALELEEGDEAVRAEGHGWLYVEPDGDVRVAQGHADVVGNLAKDPWDEIWRNVQQA